MKYPFALVLVIPLALACTRMEYDTSDGVNHELTLFERQLTVPVGSIGPVTLETVLGSLNSIPVVGSLVSEMLKVDEQGLFYMESSGDIFKMNAYEVEKQMGDASVPQSWNSGDHMTSLGGAGILLSMVAMQPIGQKVDITVSNPISKSVAATSSSSLSCAGKDVPIEALNSFTLRSRTNGDKLMSLDIPQDQTDALNTIEMKGLTLALPANPSSLIRDETGNLFFTVGYKYSHNIVVSDIFNFPLTDLHIAAAKLPIGQYKFKKCEISLELENSLPLQVEVKDIRAVKHRESEDVAPEADDNIKITSGFTIQGGSLEKPATTELALAIEALEGTIPDINGILLSIELKAQPGFTTVPVSAKQGLYIKSSSAKLTGGITIPIK